MARPPTPSCFSISQVFKATFNFVITLTRSLLKNEKPLNWQSCLYQGIFFLQIEYDAYNITPLNPYDDFVINITIFVKRFFFFSTYNQHIHTIR